MDRIAPAMDAVPWMQAASDAGAGEIISRREHRRSMALRTLDDSPRKLALDFGPLEM